MKLRWYTKTQTQRYWDPKDNVWYISETVVIPKELQFFDEQSGEWKTVPEYKDK